MHNNIACPQVIKKLYTLHPPLKHFLKFNHCLVVENNTFQQVRKREKESSGIIMHSLAGISETVGNYSNGF